MILMIHISSLFMIGCHVGRHYGNTPASGLHTLIVGDTVSSPDHAGYLSKNPYSLSFFISKLNSFVFLLLALSFSVHSTVY